MENFGVLEEAYRLLKQNSIKIPISFKHNVPTFLDRHIKQHLIISLIFPIKDYGCIVYNGLNVAINEKIERWLRISIRLIFTKYRENTQESREIQRKAWMA